MARTTATNFSGGLQFPYATAATDVFKKEDVQTLAQAVDQHDHTAGKGHSINTVPANASITNAMLGSDVARANQLTNGGFEVWQRGAGPFPTAGTYSADGWLQQPSGADTLSISQNTTNPDASSNVCAAVTYTRSVGGSAFQQKIESYGSLKGRTCSVSFRVRVSTANAVRVGLYDQINGWRYGGYHTGGGAYETLTVSAPIAATATVVYVAVFFDQSCTAYIDNAMLVVGSQAADYAPLHPADDLARCLRYYENLAGGIGSGSTFVLTSYAAAGATAYIWVPALAQMAITPTATKVGTWSISNCAQPVAYGTNPQGATVSTVATAAGQVFLQGAVNAGLTLEANP